eukprot:jgi/Chlat1/3603/Chrsp234S00260
MVTVWWGLLAVPVYLLGTLRKGGRADGGGRRRGAPAGGDAPFVCERVCASPALLRSLGGMANDPASNTCVTVCGTSQEDAWTEACQRSVCVNPHQIPAWNDACLKRCTQELHRNLR